MGITSSNKVVGRSEIQCDGQLKVTLALTASPDIIENPTDIVLVLDRSGSMAGVPLAAVKEGADTFIDIIQQATSNGGGSGELGSGTKMGVVSFATTARQDTAMITSVANLKGAVNALVAGGSTNHGDAFAQATELLETGTNPVKVMVMFTDGNTTAGPPPAPIADLAKAKGIIIYCIGLVGTDGLDVSALNDWATDPDSIHVAIAPTPADLEEIFAELAANLTKPGATDLKIVEEVNPDFEITEILPPDKGTVEQQTDTKLTWRMDSLGVDAVESATLSFLIRHRSDTGGLKLVNQSIQYTDAQGNLVVFPDPTVRVGCDVIIHPEPCPTPVDVTVEGCTDAVVVDAGEIALDSVGRILQVDVTVKDVCPSGVSGDDSHRGGRQRGEGDQGRQSAHHSGPPGDGVPGCAGALCALCSAGGWGKSVCNPEVPGADLCPLYGLRFCVLP